MWLYNFELNLCCIQISIISSPIVSFREEQRLKNYFILCDCQINYTQNERFITLIVQIRKRGISMTISCGTIKGQH